MPSLVIPLVTNGRTHARTEKVLCMTCVAAGKNIEINSVQPIIHPRGDSGAASPSSLSYHFPLGAEEGVALERLVLVGGDEGEDAVVRRVRRAVRDPEMELK